MKVEGGASKPLQLKGLKAPLQLAKVKGASKPSKPSKGQRSPFSLSLEGFEAFLSFEAFEAPFVPILKAFEGFEGGFEALKGDFATFVWFHFLLISFSSLLTPKAFSCGFLLFSFGENVGF